MGPATELIHLAVSIASWLFIVRTLIGYLGRPCLHTCDVMLAGLSQEHFKDNETNKQLFMLTRHQLRGCV